MKDNIIETKYIYSKQLDVYERNIEEKFREYEKPIIKKEEIMMFMFDGLNPLKTKIICRQCSSCHGCR